MRVMYLAKSDVANIGQNVQSLLSTFKQYAGPGPINNGFAPSPSDPYDYSWENTKKRRTPWRGEELFESYIEREGFYPHIQSRSKSSKWFSRIFFFLPGGGLWGVDHFSDVYLFNKDMGYRKMFRLMYEGFVHPFEHPHPDEVFIINLEELASLWHLPGTVSTTPGIKRIDSITNQAPNNLPR